MAQQGVLLDQDQFCCSVCLDLLKEPVTIPCGHSYCRSCIEGCWDQDVLKGVYSCPQCRHTFTTRPMLMKNSMLAELVEKLKKTGLQAAPPPVLCYAGPGDVACDFCTGTRKQKALMSCLVCLASYCETHLQPHYESPALKKHKLVKATAQLQEKICSHHDKLLEVYCRTDQQCICHLCVMDEHKGHDTVSAAAERTEKQRQLGMSQQKVQQRFQEREKELKELQQTVESLKRSAQSAVEDSDQIFTELICSIERRSSEVKELIRAQEKAQVSQAEGLLGQLKQEIAELRKRSTELEQLSHTEDHIHFLQRYQSLSSISVSSDLPSIVVRPLQSFGDASKTVSELREKLEDFLKGEWTKISTTVNIVDVVLPPEPKTREQLLQCGTRSGEIISAPSIPGTVLINTADLMQRWTSDVFLSVVRLALPFDTPLPDEIIQDVTGLLHVETDLR
ncbi:E3 ubiquitin/ISG15 ligase TRIM25 isoform X3 [Oncorhynchus mykiss]|uniref:E3 ubiquitin/ISG15 ligase TRIM25 isoform X3 n=1 Tax=Oncorhynchus mykiss TaxID=8022 RepID=UPI001877E767|nr:E3 ubiquitin/ISG15 ligase TRIM25 isoform X3 [Oncorhynchus mykiss]